MNMAILRGRLSSAPRVQALDSGDVLVRYEVTVPRDDGPAESVPVACFASAQTPALDAGDEVVVLGRVRRRFFRAGTGGTHSRTEVVADSVLPATDRRRVRAALARAAAALAE